MCALQESAQITFRPLYGAGSKHEPLCFLLCVDELTILLDCGWNDKFDLDTIAPLIRYCRILLTWGLGARGLVRARDAWRDRSGRWLCG